MCNFPGTKAGHVSTACAGVLQGQERLFLGPIRLVSFHTISESSSLFNQSKRGNGGSFCQSHQIRGKQGKETQNADLKACFQALL